MSEACSNCPDCGCNETKTWRDYDTIEAVDGLVVERLGTNVGTWSPDQARERAAMLVNAAEEAESVPRFSESDALAIANLDRFDCLRGEERLDLVHELRALRKPRAS